jgi:hypothetical protein
MKDKKDRYYSWTVSCILALTITGPSFSYSLGPAVIRLGDLLLLFLTIVVVISGPIILYKYSYFLILPLVVIGLYAAILSAISGSSPNTMIELIDLTTIIVLFAIAPVLFFYGNNIVKKTLFVVFILTVMGSVTPIIYFIQTGDRPFGVLLSFGSPVLALFYALTVYIHNKSILIGLGGAVVLFRILFQQTRLVWIFAPVAGVLILYNSNNNIKNVLNEHVNIIYSFLSVLLIAIVSVPSIRERLLSIVEGSQALFARPTIYYAGLSAFWNNPLGHGLGTFSEAVGQSIKSNETTYPDWFINIAGERVVSYVPGKIVQGETGPHSDLIKMAVELGIIGIICYCLFLLISIKLLLYEQKTAQSKVLAAASLYFILTNLINPGILSNGGNMYAILFSMYMFSIKGRPAGGWFKKGRRKYSKSITGQENSDAD